MKYLIAVLVLFVGCVAGPRAQDGYPEMGEEIKAVPEEKSDCPSGTCPYQKKSLIVGKGATWSPQS